LGCCIDSLFVLAPFMFFAATAAAAAATAAAPLPPGHAGAGRWYTSGTGAGGFHSSTSQINDTPSQR